MCHYFVTVLIFMSSLNLISCWAMNDVDFNYFYEQENHLFEEDYDMSAEDLARMKIALIYPGTKWCGTGDIADSYDDLGPSVEADSCCREHDHCSDSILAGESKYNLTNTSFYTRLHCACDYRFFECLRAGNTTTSNRVGTMYFNVIGTQCYREDYLITGCEKKGGWLNTKCVEYSYDTSSEKTYQWFDVPKY